MAPLSIEARLEASLHRIRLAAGCVELPAVVVEGVAGLIEVDGVVFCGIERLGSAATMTVLAAVCGLDRSVTSRHVDALETAGLVVRVAHERDARAIRVEYTVTGKEVLARAQERLRSRYGRHLTGWTNVERMQFVELLERFTEGLDAV